MGSCAHDVARYLADQSVGGFGANTGWSINVAGEPASPDDCVTVYDTGGNEPDTDDMDLQPTFQVRVRSADYQTAYAKSEAIRALLILPNALTMNGSEYVGVWMSSDIVAIGRDESNRHLLVANYRARKEL